MRARLINVEGHKLIGDITADCQKAIAKRQMVQMGKIESAGEKLGRAGIPPVPPVHPPSDRHFKERQMRQEHTRGKFTFQQHLVAEWFKAELRKLESEGFERKMLREAEAAQGMWLAANPSEANRRIENLLALAEALDARLKGIGAMKDAPYSRRNRKEEQMRLLFSGAIHHNLDQPLLAIIGAAGIVQFTLQSQGKNRNEIKWSEFQSRLSAACTQFGERIKKLIGLDIENAKTAIHPANNTEMFII